MADNTPDDVLVEAITRAIRKANNHNHRYFIPIVDPYRYMAKAALAAVAALTAGKRGER